MPHPLAEARAARRRSGPAMTRTGVIATDAEGIRVSVQPTDGAPSSVFYGALPIARRTVTWDAPAVAFCHAIGRRC